MFHEGNILRGHISGWKGFMRVPFQEGNVSGACSTRVMFKEGNVSGKQYFERLIFHEGSVSIG